MLRLQGIAGGAWFFYWFFYNWLLQEPWFPPLLTSSLALFFAFLFASSSNAIIFAFLALEIFSFSALIASRACRSASSSAAVFKTERWRIFR